MQKNLTKKVTWHEPSQMATEPADRAVALWRDKDMAVAVLPFLSPAWGLAVDVDRDRPPRLARGGAEMWWQDGENQEVPVLMVATWHQQAMAGANPIEVAAAIDADLAGF